MRQHYHTGNGRQGQGQDKDISIKNLWRHLKLHHSWSRGENMLWLEVKFFNQSSLSPDILCNNFRGWNLSILYPPFLCVTGTTVWATEKKRGKGKMVLVPDQGWTEHGYICYLGQFSCHCELWHKPASLQTWSTLRFVAITLHKNNKISFIRWWTVRGHGNDIATGLLSDLELVILSLWGSFPLTLCILWLLTGRMTSCSVLCQSYLLSYLWSPSAAMVSQFLIFTAILLLLIAKLYHSITTNRSFTTLFFLVFENFVSSSK